MVRNLDCIETYLPLTFQEIVNSSIRGCLISTSSRLSGGLTPFALSLRRQLAWLVLRRRSSQLESARSEILGRT